VARATLVRATLVRAILVPALLLAGCSSSSPTPAITAAPSGAPGGSTIVPPATTPAATTGVASARPSFPPFDPSAVSLTLQPFASVPGGPLAIVAPHDGSGRLFVAAQDGGVWIVNRDGTTRSSPLLSLGGQLTTGGERGLLGIALHPSFPADPRVYVDYTDLNGNTVVASYRLDTADPDRLDPSTAAVILRVQQPFANHNGGALAFGPDGDLYISLGDGGSEGDPQGNGQRLDTDLGKILRIDVDRPSPGQPYAIPAGNPFAGTAGDRAEIWLDGLRNPWRMSFDDATGDLWIGDVGQDAWEEVDVARAGVGGLNFGWNRMEGDHCYSPSQGCNQSGLTPPVAEYGHDQGCVVIGGVVYRGSRYPFLQGGYLYADYCSGKLWALDADASLPMAGQVGMAGAQIVAFGEDEGGEVYVADLNGTISQVVATAR
jgi:glucose/arabinose dehydrogenase